MSCNCLIDQNFPAQTLGSLLRLALGSSNMGSRFSWRLKVFDVKMRGLGEGKALGLLGGHTCLLNPPRSHIWRFLLVGRSGGACRTPSRMASQASGQRYPEYISTYLSPQRLVLRTPLCPVFSLAPGSGHVLHAAHLGSSGGLARRVGTVPCTAPPSADPQSCSWSAALLGWVGAGNSKIAFCQPFP